MPCCLGSLAYIEWAYILRAVSTHAPKTHQRSATDTATALLSCAVLHCLQSYKSAAVPLLIQRCHCLL
eukprot:3475716-Pyramimonas_sp.AAC.1